MCVKWPTIKKTEVSSCKKCLLRNGKFKFNELNTILVVVEKVVNKRFLKYLSELRLTIYYTGVSYWKVNSYTQQEFEDTDEENLLNHVKSLKLYFSLIGAALTKNILLLFIRELCILYLKLIREVHCLKMAL